MLVSLPTFIRFNCWNLTISRRNRCWRWSWIMPGKFWLSKWFQVLAVLDLIMPGESRMRGVMLYELHLPNVMLGNRWGGDYNDDDDGGGVVVVVVVGGGGGGDDALLAPLAQCDACKQVVNWWWQCWWCWCWSWRWTPPRMLQAGPGSGADPKEIKKRLRTGLDCLKKGLAILEVCWWRIG